MYGKLWKPGLVIKDHVKEQELDCQVDDPDDG